MVRSIFYKSKYLILLFSVEVMLLLFLGSMIRTQIANRRPMTFLQSSFSYIQLLWTEAEGYEDLRSVIAECIKDDYLIVKDYSMKKGGAVLFSTAQLFPLKMTEGRCFNRDDFEKHSNVAIVNTESDRVELERESNREYLVVNDKRYVVIGKYHQRQTANSKDWFINLMAENLFDETTDGLYELDTGSNLLMNEETRESLTIKLQTHYASDVSVEIEQGLSEAGSLMDSNITNYNYGYIMTIGSLILLLLNSIQAIQYWLRTRRKELYIRRMVGATEKANVRWLNGELLVLAVVSGGIGTGFTILLFRLARFLPVKESVTTAFGERLSLVGMAIGIAAMLLIAMIEMKIILRQSRRNGIAGGLK